MALVRSPFVVSLGRRRQLGPGFVGLVQALAEGVPVPLGQSDRLAIGQRLPSALLGRADQNRPAVAAARTIKRLVSGEVRRSIPFIRRRGHGLHLNTEK